MKKKTSERLLIIELSILGFDILVFDSQDLKDLKHLLEAVSDNVNLEHKDNRNVTLKWWGSDAIYYYQINDDGNIVLKDLISR